MIRLFTKGLASIATVFLYPVYFLSGLTPRRPNLWVFGSWGGYRFADNAAAFFLHCSSHVGDAFDLVWISRNFAIVSQLRRAGHNAHWVWSPRGILCCARAGVFLFDCYSKDINFWLSRRALRVNLSHGVPLKTFERDIDLPSNRYYKLFHGPLPVRWLYSYLMPWHVNHVDQFICTSPATQEIVCRAFDVTAEMVAVTGYPRNDVMFRHHDAGFDPISGVPKSVVEAKNAGKKIFMYLPTFRDSGRPYMGFEWARLDEFLSRRNAILFYKLHPQDQSNVRENLGNIIKLDKGIDLYTMMESIDVLISDYSSVIFDYMLLDRPIIYYVPDLPEFLSENRSLYFDIGYIAAGAQCETFDRLLEAMDLALRQHVPADENSRYRSEITRFFHTHLDGNSGERVLRVVLKRIQTTARTCD